MRRSATDPIVGQEIWLKEHLVCLKPVSGIQYITYMYIFIKSI